MTRTGGYFDEIKKIEQFRREELKKLQRELAKLEATEKSFRNQNGDRPQLGSQRGRVPAR